MKTPQVRLAELVNKIPGCKQPWDAIPPGVFLISFPPPGSENVLRLPFGTDRPDWFVDTGISFSHLRCRLTNANAS